MAAPTNTNVPAAGSPSPPSGSASPPKPWERVESSTSGPTPFRPPSNSSTSTAVEEAGAAKPGEIVTSTSTLARDVPQRPWNSNYGSSYGGPISSMNYNSGYGSSMVGGGLYGGSYGSGLYGNNMYRGYGPYGNSMYGGGMYGGGYGGGMMSGYGMGMGGPYGNQDPNNPFGGPPPSPPGFWMSFLQVMQGVVNIFGRISILIDQNTQALHMFMSALLQLFDRSGMLYGELARFVLRLLGVKTKPRKQQMMGPGELPGPAGQQQYIDGPKAAVTAPPIASWNNVWGN